MIHVLTADGSTARLYEVSPVRKSLREVVAFGNAVARLHERDLVTSRPGRVRNRIGGVHQVYEPAVSEKARATERWLAGVAGALEPLLKSRESHGVILVAAPRTLAPLKENIPSALRKWVLGEVPRNLCGLPALELGVRLKPAVLEAEQRLASRRVVQVRRTRPRKSRTSASVV